LRLNEIQKKRTVILIDLQTDDNVDDSVECELR